MNKYLKYLIIVLVILSGCSWEEDCHSTPDISNINCEVTVERLDRELFKCKSKEEVSAFLSQHPDVENSFLEGRGKSSAMITDYLFQMIGNKSVDTLRKEVEQTFGDASELKSQLEEGFKILKFYYPETKDVTLKTVISGLRKDIYANDTVVIVGLDYFLGEGATYRPNNYGYINARYKPAAIPSFVFKFISGKYNKTDPLDNTLLADMIFYGKSYYFTNQLLPCTSDSLIIGYSPVDWEGSELHIKKIWSAFIERELLYETSHIVKSKYVGERPKTFEIGNKCPGRIGRFLGWKIVNAYMENNPEVTLKELMEEKDARKIFNLSKFKPAL